jgi:hypothetical protein
VKGATALVKKQMASNIRPLEGETISDTLLTLGMDEDDMEYKKTPWDNE